MNGKLNNFIRFKNAFFQNCQPPSARRMVRVLSRKFVKKPRIWKFNFLLHRVLQIWTRGRIPYWISKMGKKLEVAISNRKYTNRAHYTFTKPENALFPFRIDMLHLWILKIQYSRSHGVLQIWTRSWKWRKNENLSSLINIKVYLFYKRENWKLK